MAEGTVKQRPSLIIKRHYPAAPEKVWRAITAPEALQRWMAPTDGFSIPIAESDVRVGGRYRIVMVEPGGKEHDVSGVYREVNAPRRLSYTWTWKGNPDEESIVTIELRGNGGGTDLTLTHAEFVDEDTRGRHQQGWNGCLDRLAAAL
jgi:uncharacterized protein YndB with AHSA1/START domain